MDLIVSVGAIILVIFLGWITPGPNMFAVMAASLQHGRNHGLATGLGMALATFLWATLAVLGVSVVFDLFPRTVLALKLFGAAYLLWLGIKSIKDALNHNHSNELNNQNDRSLRKSMLNGFLVSMGNPKAALFFGSVMTAFIPSTAASWFLYLVVLLCGILSGVLHSVTATVFSTHTAVRFFTKFRVWITIAFGTLFIALGAGIIYSVLRKTQ